MPLVFVHGVANRMSAGYLEGERARDALFHQYLLRNHRRDDGKPVRIVNPFWGKHGAKLHWGGASLPLEKFQALGSQDVAIAGFHGSALPEGKLESATTAVLEVARAGSLPDAVDLLWEATGVEAADDEIAGSEVAALSRSVLAYAEANPEPAWLDDVSDDQDFITRLETEVDAFTTAGGAAVPAPEWQSLGIGSAWQWVRKGAARIRTAVVDMVGKEAAERIRPAILPPVANFIGDVFQYLHQQRDAAGKIRETVEAAIREAAAEATPEDPLVVVAHSMGGNIVYDLVTQELDDVTITLLVTAGTQVGLFEELKLFRSSDDTFPGSDTSRRLTRPPNVTRWLNIFDHSDFLGFEVGSIIEGVDDFAYPTGALLKSHSMYFLQPRFHERLVKRLEEQGDPSS